VLKQVAITDEATG